MLLHPRIVICCALAVVAWVHAPALAIPTSLPALCGPAPDTSAAAVTVSGESAAPAEPAFLADNLIQSAIWQNQVLSGESRIPRSLPGAPGAIFMGLLGLGLVISVRERKGILAVCASLLLAGQFGISSLPRLTGRLIKGKLHTAQLTAQRIDALFIHEIHNASDIATRRYLGLLYRLSESSAAGASSQIALLQKVTERQSVAAQSVCSVPLPTAVLPFRAIHNCNHRSLRQQCDFAKPLLASFLPHLASRAPPASC